MKILNKLFENYNETLNESLEDDVPNNFNMEKFKSLSSYNKRIQYCNDNLERIASGSARIVYKVNNSKVLKLAKNPKGIDQNEVEVQLSNDYYINGLVANIFDHDDDFLWVESELCKKLTPKKFYEITEIKFKDFSNALQYNFSTIINRGKGLFATKPSDDVWDNEYFSQFNDLMINYNLPAGDLTRISSYGINSEGSVVLTDYGLTQEVLDKHYK